MRLLRNTSLKVKLCLLGLIIGVVPLGISLALSFYFSQGEIIDQAERSLKITSSDKAHAIEHYFSNNFESLVDLSQSPLTIQLVQDFKRAYGEYASIDIPESRIQEVKSFYLKQFIQRYAEKNNNEVVNIEEYFNRLSPEAVGIQVDYLKREGLQDPINQTYHRLHQSYHDYFASFLKRHGLYDVFLMDDRGRMVYSVEKEIDVGVNLLSGPLENSGLRAAFAGAKNIKYGEIHFEDFALYVPSYNAPASFAASPLYDGDRFVGVVAIQLPLDKITEIANQREGLGISGQLLIAGSDGRLRSDSFRDPEQYSVGKSFGYKGVHLRDYEPFQKAITGDEGSIHVHSIDSEAVFAYYRTAEIKGKSWVLITELSESELFAGLNLLKWIFISIITGAFLIVGMASWWTGKSIGDRLKAALAELTVACSQVYESSLQSKESSRSAASAVTEQASSLQETIASSEQISAMVGQNADSAAKAKDTVEENERSATEGLQSVEGMMSAMTEISQANQGILDQIERGNEQFEKMLQIIGDIGTKTKVINEIVFQTKLLSFNASVEAARAGEHGKGFAVVAEEVGNLARMSGGAANEITEMLNESIKTVDQIVKENRQNVERMVQISRKKLDQGTSTAERCQSVFGQMANNARVLSEMITEIAHASQEQAQGIQEINSAIAQLDQATQENSVVANTISAQSDHLLKQAEHLESNVLDLRSFVDGDHRGATSIKDSANGREPRFETADVKLSNHGKPQKRTINPGNSHIKTTSKGIPNGKLIAMSPRPQDLRHTNSKGRGQSAQTTRQQKQAVNAPLIHGTDEAPSANHPDFEDF